MRKLVSLSMCLVICQLLLPYGIVRASEGIADIWQLDYADFACSTLLEAAADCSLCHTIPPQTNPYGQEIADAGFGWFVVEPLDSDGDGRTNGEEIYTDCTLPGDGTSPTERTSWSRILALYY
jgi:hypothetical protein